MSDIIPCEICDELIPVTEYSRHLEGCITNRLFNINFVIDDRTRRVHNENSISASETESEDESREAGEYIYDIHNLRDFTGRLFRTYDQRTTSHHGDAMNIIFVPMGNRTLGIVEQDDYETNLQLANTIGKVEIGVSNMDNVSSVISHSNVNIDEICPICRESFSNTGGLRKLICKHIYCDQCITTWLSNHKKCPVCMTDLEELVQKN